MIVFIKPKEGLEIRKPDLSFLRKEGERLPLSPFWLRRKAQGEVLISESRSPLEAPKKDKKVKHGN